jgi:putative FmdB family regulatory protein
MPTYEYKCPDCDTFLSEVRSINDPEPEHLCEKCGNKMNKKFNLGAITFNGSGFYRTDK